MRLRLWDRLRRFVDSRRPRAAGAQGAAPPGAAGPAPGWLRPPVAPGRPGLDLPSGSAGAAPGPGRAPEPAGWAVPDPATSAVPARTMSGSPDVRVGGARARVRENPGEAAVAAAAPRQRRVRPRAAVADQRDARSEALTRAAAGIPRQDGRSSWRDGLRATLPFAAPHAAEEPWTADGRRHCGSLESILWRQWDAMMLPPAEIVEAVDRLAELPEQIKEKLAAGLDAIFVGPGGVPELDEMTALRGVLLPSGQASWDACAGAYGDRKVVVGSRPSPTPDVMCHEVGHALDDLDSPAGKWQSDSAEFRILYDQCDPLSRQRLPPSAGRPRAQGVFRRRVRRDRVGAAAGPGGHAERGHADRAEGHAVFQQTLWHLG